MAEKEITIEIKNLEVIALFAILLAFFVIEVQMTLSRPIVFGDEGHHAKLSQWIGQNVEYPKWVPFAGTNLEKRGFTRPALWNLLGASLIFIFGFHESILKFLIPFVGVMITGPAIFALTKKLFNKEVAFIATIIAISIPSFVTYSVLYYTDALLTLYLSLSILTLILAIETNHKKYWIVSGLFAGLAFFTKSAGYALFFVAGVFFLYQCFKNRQFFKNLKNYVIWTIFAAILVGTFFGRNYILFQNLCSDIPLSYQGPGKCEILDPYVDQYKYTSTAVQAGTEVSVIKFGIIEYLNFAYGNVWFVFFGLLCGLMIMAARKNEKDILILLSLLPILVIYFRTPDTRAENMSRYLLGWVPIIGIVVANYFETVYDFVKKYQKYLALAVFIIVIFFSYQNLKEKVDGMYNVKGQWSQNFWDGCNYIKNNLPKDARVFTIWAGPTEFNCQRNIGGGGGDVVLSGNLTLAYSRLKAQGVTHIFIQKGTIGTQQVSEVYNWNFIQLLQNNPDYFKKLYENGESNLQNCLYGRCDGAIIYEVK